MATKTFTGTLVLLNVKKGVGKRGPWKAYSGKVEKANGEEYDEWVSFGFEKPECAQGDEVVIVTKKEDGYWKAQEVTVTKAADQEEDSDDDSESGDSGTEETPNSDESDQQESSPSKSKKRSSQTNIHYQNSRTAAIELADLLLKHKAVPLSATAGKAGEAKRFEEVTALVNKLTVIFFHDLESFRLVNDIEDVYEKPKAEAGFDPEEEQSDSSDDE